MVFNMSEHIKFGNIAKLIDRQKLKAVKIFSGDMRDITIEMLVIWYLSFFVMNKTTHSQPVIKLSCEFETNNISYCKAPFTIIHIAAKDFIECATISQDHCWPFRTDINFLI